MKFKLHIKKTKGYLKIQFAVGVNAKAILVLEVFEEKVNEERSDMPKLIEPN